MPYGTFLNGRAPVRLRGLAWLALSDTGVVNVRVYTSDQGGGASQVWTAGASVPCRLESVAERGQSSPVAGRIDERSTHIVTAPAGTQIESDDRFVIAGRGTYEVTAMRERTAEWVREFEVVELT